jgi:hypothetical protein
LRGYFVKDIKLFAAVQERKTLAENNCYGIDLGTTNSSVAAAYYTFEDQTECRILEIDQQLWPAGSMKKMGQVQLMRN